MFFNTHPIQYFAPLYKEINDDDSFDLEVWYGSDHGLGGEIDKQFGTKVKWDIPILEGYKYKFLKNYSWKPGLYNGFFGLINLGVWKELSILPKKSIIIVHGWKPFTTIFLIISAKIKGHRTCLRSESPLSHEAGRGYISLFIRKIILKYFLFNFYDYFLYIGIQNKLFYKNYGVPNSKLIFTPYAVNNSYFQREARILAPLRETIKANLNIPPTHKILLFSGKYIDKKRPLDLLRAFSMIQGDVTLILLGEGNLRNQMEEEINNSRIKNVILTGFINQSQISEFYTIADIFIMCSDYGETWGLSTNEAMNFSLPIIVSDRTGNHSDLIRENGLVFTTGDILDLKNKILTILSKNEEDRILMGNKSRDLINEYSYKKIIKNLKLIGEN